jgi:hypothetical protein
MLQHKGEAGGWKPEKLLLDSELMADEVHGQ